MWRASKVKAGCTMSDPHLLRHARCTAYCPRWKHGNPCLDFGTKGETSLTKDVDLAKEWSGGYEVTSAPAIYKDLVITGSSIADNWKADTERGIVRAFDVRTGKLRWTWNPIPWAEASMPRTGGANAWSTLSVDAEHDLFSFPLAAPALTTPAQFAKVTTNGRILSGIAGIYGKICLGVPGGPPRSVGLRRCFSAFAFSTGGMALQLSPSTPRWDMCSCSTA